MKLYRYFLLLITALLLELTLFNYKYYATLANESFVPEYEVGDGLVSMGDGRYEVLQEGSYTVRLTGLKREVRTLRFDIGYAENEQLLPEDATKKERSIQTVRESERKKIYVQIKAQDKANELGLVLGARDIVHEVSQTTYLMTHLAGESEWVEYTLTVEPGDIVKLYELEVNPRIPFSFSVWRFLAVTAVLMLVCLLRPDSAAYQFPCRREALQSLIVWCCILAEILFFARLVILNPYFINPSWSHHRQYYELAEAFHSRQLYLKEEPPEFLKQMENPYDSALRAEKAKEAGESAAWDHAYYDGKYYVYFGVVPELLFYYPYYELTGSAGKDGEFEGGELAHYKIIFLCAAAGVVAVYLLLGEIIRLWYRRTPFVLYLLLAAALSMGNGVLTILLRPDFYSVPIICGLTLSMFGLYFWLAAKQTVSEERETAGALQVPKLMAGSLCMALVAGCRPQLLVLSFLALPLFLGELKKKSITWKRKLGELICFGLPYLFVAVGLMYYNMARFGSPFDFGANYNLTTNDMTQRGMEAGRIGLGLFAYLFQPANLEAVFPFLIRNNFASTYLGLTIKEGTYGGIFAVNLMLAPVLFLPWLKKYVSNKESFWMAVLSALGGLVVVVADTQMAGILSRYYTDFSFMFLLSAALLLLCGYEYCLTVKERGEGLPMRLYRSFLIAAVLSGIAYHGLRIFAGNTSTLIIGNPKVFYEAAQRIAFWR